jgi:hypothetical protein
MEGAWRPVQATTAPVRVWLPPGGRLDEVGGMDYWSPDPEQGRFTVAPSGDGDALLSAEREAGGEVTVELDERQQRGGLDVRRLRYRVRVQTPREVLLDGVERHVGGTPAEHLSDVLVLPGGVRVGYTVRADADPEVGATLAEVLDRVQVGSEA